ncbi:MAG: hypothetical protein HC892_23885 [Saprospiraceae bacterium]|nr:hypothetical protein [Saprospiraceae bacterium]
MSSCGNLVKFPVSTVVPTADISITQKKDKNGNTAFSLKAKNLSAANRLSPPRNFYVVWAVTNENGIKNLGQLSNKNAGKATLETTTSFITNEVFITAEEQGNISYPTGTEITRVALNK